MSKQTRKDLWNTNRPQPPPDSKGYWLSGKCHNFWTFSANFRWQKVSKGTSTHQNLSFGHIHLPLRPFICTHSHVHTTILYKKTVWKSSCFEKPPFLDTLAIFGQLPVTQCGRNCQKAHPYAKNFYLHHFHVYTTIRYKETSWKSSYKKRCFWTFWPNSAIFGGWILPKLSKGTSTRKDLSFEPIPGVEIRWFSHSPNWRVSQILHSPANIYTRQKEKKAK